jgi:hypothetical protein
MLQLFILQSCGITMSLDLEHDPILVIDDYDP